MAKVLTGKVVSIAMQGVAVVEVTRKTPHPLYKKLLKRSKKFKVALNGNTVALDEIVSIIETRPLSKDMHFALKDASDKKVTKAEKKEVPASEVEVKEKKTIKKATKKKEAKK